jgi:pyroglutamyl-peptidase
MRKLLITGFGPFPRVPRNPSEGLARAVARDPRWRRRGIAVEALVLETRYAAIDTHLIPKIREFRPDAILMLGVAARRRHVSIETRAMNRVSRLMPDAGGQIASQLAYRPGAPPALRSRAPVAAMARAMRECGLAARLSRDAGRYLCNAAYFAALLETSSRTRTKVAFIHIPLPAKRDKPRATQPQACLARLAAPGMARPARQLSGSILGKAVTEAGFNLLVRAVFPKI